MKEGACYEICQKSKIPHKKIGKLIVATEQEEVKALEKLFNQGMANGVEGIKMIPQAELSTMEPNINGIAALYSPETGIIDSHRLMQFLMDRAKENGVIIGFQMEVTGIDKLSGGYKVTIKNNAEVAILKSRIIINCAGLDSDSIAAMPGVDINSLRYRLYYCKGNTSG